MRAKTVEGSDSAEIPDHLSGFIRRLNETELPWMEDGKLKSGYSENDLIMGYNGSKLEIAKVGNEELKTWNDLFRHSGTVPDQIYIQKVNAGSRHTGIFNSHNIRELVLGNPSQSEESDSLICEVQKYYLGICKKNLFYLAVL